MAPAVMGLAFQPFHLRNAAGKMFHQHGDIAGALAQRRQHNGKHVMRWNKVPGESRRWRTCLFQIAMRRHHYAHVHAPPDRPRRRARSRRPPGRAAVLLASPAACPPISSKNSVPRWACSNLPRCREAAPVNAPFSCPNSSDSISSCGTAAQFRVYKCRLPPRTPLMHGPRHQLLARAGFTQDADARFPRRHTLHLRHHPAHGLALPNNLVTARCAAAVRDSRVLIGKGAARFSTVRRSFSEEIGFSRKSTAP